MPTEAVAAGVEEEDGLALGLAEDSEEADDDTLMLEEREAERVPTEGVAREVALLDTQGVEESEAEKVPTEGEAREVALLDTQAEAKRVPAAEGETRVVTLVNKLAVKRVDTLAGAPGVAEVRAVGVSA